MTQQLPARPEDLPATLAEVAEMFGLRVALQLMEAFGGLEVKFPVNPKPDHPVIKALGETDGRALCQYFCGALVYIPHNRTKSVRADVVRLEAQGLNRSQIARRLNVSQRHVRRMANRSDDDSQLKLSF